MSEKHSRLTRLQNQERRSRHPLSPGVLTRARLREYEPSWGRTWWSFEDPGLVRMRWEGRLRKRMATFETTISAELLCDAEGAKMIRWHWRKNIEALLKRSRHERSSQPPTAEAKAEANQGDV